MVRGLDESAHVSGRSFVCSVQFGLVVIAQARVRVELEGMWALPWPDISTSNRDPMYKKSWPKEFSLSARLILLFYGIRYTVAASRTRMEWNGETDLPTRRNSPLAVFVARRLAVSVAPLHTERHSLHSWVFRNVFTCLFVAFLSIGDSKLSGQSLPLWILIFNWRNSLRLLTEI